MRFLLLAPLLALTCNLSDPPVSFSRLTRPDAAPGTPDGIAPEGDRENSYAWCMDILPQEDGDYLYVGSNRDLLAVFLFGGGFTEDQYPKMFGDAVIPATDLRGRIFRYRLDGAKPWEEAYRSPFLPGSTTLPREIGYRGCQTFTADGETALYIASSSPFGSVTSRLLKIPTTFRPGDEPAEVLRLAPAGLDTTNSLRPLAVHDGKFYVGSQANQVFETASPRVQPAGDGPSTEGWTPVAWDADFGGVWASHRQSLWQFASFDGRLWASLGNVEPDPDKIPRGFTLFAGRSDPGNPKANAAGWVWEPIVADAGAYPPGLGQERWAAASLAVFRDHLYVGTMTDVLGPLFMKGAWQIFNAITPSHLYRIGRDGHWDLLVGETDALFPVRLGNYRAGFYFSPPEQTSLPKPYNTANFSLNEYFWWMEAHGGYLYLATFDIRIFVRFLSDECLRLIGVSSPADRARILKEIDYLDKVNDNPAGFDLYATPDGQNWIPITRDGLGDPWNWGGRTLKSTKVGLFLGTANPFWGAQVYRGE